jgi:RNA polymerase sigma-70 factor (ECF subfamily)
VRAIESPPRSFAEPIRPWLVRVAVNLCRDLLRRRRRRHYVGEWLPSPVPTEDPPAHEPPMAEDDSPSARYEMLESLSLAFLLALEALTPTARAVLLLRDVFDYSTQETAEALGVSETSVKVTLHRARKAMSGYDRERARKKKSLSDVTKGALERFLYHLNNRDMEGLEQLLAEDVVSISDGGGEVYAAINPIYGRRNVTRLIFGLAEKLPRAMRVSFVTLNSLPAIVGCRLPLRLITAAGEALVDLRAESRGALHMVGLVGAVGGQAVLLLQLRPAAVVLEDEIDRGRAVVPQV